MAKNLLPTTPTGLRFVGLLGGAATLAGSAAALTFAASPASGIATLTVDSNSDAAADPTHCTNVTVGDCTLRDALAAAQDGDTITFSLAATDTITMAPAEGQFVIDHAITINGPGRTNLTVDANYADRVFKIPATVAGSVTISGLTITHGDVGSSPGGGLLAEYEATPDLDLNLSDVSFANNRTTYAGGPFSIYAADLSIDDVTVSGNQAGVRAGGRAVATSSITANRLNVTGNTATTYDGGTYLTTDGPGTTISVSNSTFASNHSLGTPNNESSGLGITDRASTSVTNSTFADNSGHGLTLELHDTTVLVANCTITGNSASTGAGIFLLTNYTDVTIAQSTITGNSITDGSVYDGAGIGFYFYDVSGSVNLTGSIIAGNTSGGSHDIGGAFSAASAPTFIFDHSLVGTVSTSASITDAGGNQFNVTDPGLNALANNGGATKTMSLKATSPAIDAGPNPVATFPGNQFDQRGTGFARIAFGRSDIGAFEIQEPPPVDPTTTPDNPVVPSFTG
jgi:hypothetical protein